nr:hypothetical protein BaRGS_009378 [Batillaria attramentaria]
MDDAPDDERCVQFSDYILSTYAAPDATFPPTLWANHDLDEDPDKLSIVISGISKPFSTWTREYARHYYPHLGHRTYRVPPVDFNTQELRDVTRLGFSELTEPKEENRKKDRSQADVAIMMEDLGKRLEATSDGGGGLFIIANAHYDNYLSDLKGVKVKGKQPPLPREVTARGEVDLLVLHAQKGILLVQVKGVGWVTENWQPTEDELYQAVRRKAKEACKQVKRDHVVLDHVMSDLQLQCAVHRVVALPFVSREMLRQSFNGTEDELDKSGTTFLCTEDLADTDAMLTWWQHLPRDDSCQDLRDDQLQSIVGRYCGLLSTVQVWAKSSLRVEVRDVAEAVSEVGSRFASIVLTPEQRAALDCQEQYAYLYGPPGSGKSVMLVVKARQWALADSDVCILNLDFGKKGMPIGHYIHDSIVQWMMKTLLETPKDRRSKTKGPKHSSSSSSSSSSEGSLRSEKDSSTSCPSTSSSGATSPAISASEESDHTNAFDLQVPGCAGTSGADLSLPENPQTADPKSVTDSFQSSSSPPHIFRVDFDLDKETAVDDLMQVIRRQVRPGIPCHFLCDEFYWKAKLIPVIEAIKREFPESCIWCAEIGGEGAPKDFVLIPLKTVLRCPPTVQAILQRTDWSAENRALYTVDSTQHGLPTDGLKPRILEHKNHQADSPLDCQECADLFLEFLRHDLKLSWPEKDEESLERKGDDLSSGTCAVSGSAGGSVLETGKNTSGINTGVAEPKGSSSKNTKTGGKAKDDVQEKTSSPSGPPVPKTKKKGHLLPRRVKFSDIVVLFAYPRKCMNPGSDLLLVRAQLQDLHHAAIQSSVFYRRVVESGVPSTFLAPNADARDIALPAQDHVIFSLTNAVTGLERKVVVYIPCESTAFPEYPLDLSQLSMPQTGAEEKATEAQEDVTKTKGQQHARQPNPARMSNEDTDVSSRLTQKWKAGVSEEDWEKINERVVRQNKFGIFYAASRCLSVFVLIIPQHEYSGPAQIFTVEAGHTYTVSGWIKLLNDQPGDVSSKVMMFLEFRYTDHTRSYMSAASHPPIKMADGWVHLVGEFLVPSDKPIERTRIYYQGPAPSVNFLVDDASVTELVMPTLNGDWRKDTDHVIDQLRKSAIHLLQTRKSFPFGSAMNAGKYDDPTMGKYRDFAHKHFNWAVPENSLKWQHIEPHKGDNHIQPALDMIHGLKNHGLKVRGHNLVWSVDKHVQGWVKAMSGDTLRHEVQHHIEWTMNQTRGLLEHWDVNNENLHGQWYQDRLHDPDYNLELFRIAHHADPNVKLFLNDYSVVASGSFTEERLDKLATVGVPIWATELDVRSMDEGQRADYYETALRALYGHPAIEGILMWGFWDQRHWLGEEAALVKGDNLQLTEAGRRVLDLLENQWMTDETHAMSQEGHKFTVRGFHGDYEVHVRYQGHELSDLKQNFTLGKDDHNVVVNVDVRHMLPACANTLVASVYDKAKPDLTLLTSASTTQVFQNSAKNPAANVTFDAFDANNDNRVELKEVEAYCGVLDINDDGQLSFPEFTGEQPELQNDRVWKMQFDYFDKMDTNVNHHISCTDDDGSIDRIEFDAFLDFLEEMPRESTTDC